MHREKLIKAAGSGLNDAFYIMQEIHQIFGTPAPRVPQVQDDFHVNRRAEWIRSEVEELLEANGSLVEQADAYLDIIVFAIGGLVELGIVPGNLYEIVIRSQLDKLWEDGRPRVREHDGKWIKPANWQDPEPLLIKEIEEQVNNAS